MQMSIGRQLKAKRSQLPRAISILREFERQGVQRVIFRRGSETVARGFIGAHWPEPDREDIEAHYDAGTYQVHGDALVLQRLS